MWCLFCLLPLVSPLFLVCLVFFFLMIRRPPRSTLFPYTTLSDLRRTAARPGPARASACSRRPPPLRPRPHPRACAARDRKSTRLNSSHPSISYAVFCLKKKKKNNTTTSRAHLRPLTRIHTTPTTP